jgi:hypothetical protein
VRDSGIQNLVSSCVAPVRHDQVAGFECSGHVWEGLYPWCHLWGATLP